MGQTTEARGYPFAGTQTPQLVVVVEEEEEEAVADLLRDRVHAPGTDAAALGLLDVTDVRAPLRHEAEMVARAAQNAAAAVALAQKQGGLLAHRGSVAEQGMVTPLQKNNFFSVSRRTRNYLKKEPKGTN